MMNLQNTNDENSGGSENDTVLLTNIDKIEEQKQANQII